MRNAVHKLFHSSLLFAGLLLLATPAFATIVYTDGQDRTTPITSSDTLQASNNDVATQSGVISGAGTVITRTSGGGEGTLNFTGINTYGGGTLLNGGRTAAGNDSAFGTGTITFNNGALDALSDVTLSNNLVVQSAQAFINAKLNNLVLNGVISGSGSVSLDNCTSCVGSITLSGNNTYSGYTRVSGVTLKISSANNLGASLGNTITGDVELGNSTLQTLAAMNFNKNIGLIGGTIDTNGFDSTFSGLIFNRNFGGGANLAKTGAGTLTLSRSNTYSGQTQILAGTLQLLDSNSAGTGQIIIANNATLKTNGSLLLRNNLQIRGTATIDSNGNGAAILDSINGDGDIIKKGPAALNFTSASGTKGAIFVQQGTLIASAGGGNFINNDIDVASGATFDASQATSTSVNWYITGGAYILTPTNIYVRNLSGSGNTLLGANTLNIDDGNSTDTAFSGTISGTAGLNKSGIHTLTLNGINTYTGTTTIGDGTLQIGDSAHSTASIAGDVGIVSSGALSGYGTIGGNVANGANVSLAQLSALTIRGNYIQSSSGTMAVQVSPTSAGKLVVGGVASLNGALALTFDPGTYTAKSYTVLTAANISGTFATIIGTAPSGFIIRPVYTPTSVAFELADPSTPPPLPSGVSEIGSVTSSTISSSNQASATIFDHLDGGGSGGDTGANDERDTLTFASLTNKSLSNSENTRDGLQGLAKALPEVAKKNGGWFKGTGNLASVESSGTKAGFSSETGGFLFGFDREIEKGLRIGAAGGYDHTNMSTFNGINASAETNSMRFALYGSKAFEDNIAVDAQMGYALHMIDGERFESSTGTMATNSHDANEYSTGFQVSKKFNLSGFTFKPKAGVNYAHVDEDGFTETGAGLFNATIASKSFNSLRLSTGFGVSHPMKPKDGWAFTPEAHIKYSYEALDSTVATSGSQRGIGFTSTGVEPSRHIVTMGIGFSANLNDDLSAFGNYDVDLPTSNSFEQTFTVGLRLNF